MVKILPVIQKTQVRSLGRPLEKKWQPIPVFLPGNPMDGGAWWATVHGITKSWTRLSNFTFFLSNLLYDPAILLIDTDLKEMNMYIHTNTSKGTVTVALFLTAKKWKHPKYPSVGKKINYGTSIG